MDRTKKIVGIIVIVGIILVSFNATKNLIESRNKPKKNFGDLEITDGTVYYKLEQYVDQGFYVISAQETQDGEMYVRLTTDGEKDASGGNYSLDIEPNTYIETTITKDQYDEWINGHECFRASLDVITLCVPIQSEETDALFYTYIAPKVDLEEYVNRAFADSQKEPGYGEGRIGNIRDMKKISEYLKKWQFAMTII